MIKRPLKQSVTKEGKTETKDSASTIVHTAITGTSHTKKITKPSLQCAHQFITIKAIFDYSDQVALRITREGMRTVCVLCGEIRDVYDTGEIFVYATRNKPTIKQDTK